MASDHKIDSSIAQKCHYKANTQRHLLLLQYTSIGIAKAQFWI